MTVGVEYGQNIYDLANKSGYTIDNIYKLIQENPFITSIDYDFDANPGKEIYFDETFKTQSPPQLTKKESAPTSTIKQGKIRDLQSFFDLIIQSGYSLDMTYKFLIDNNVTNIDADPQIGLIYNFDTSLVKDFSVYNKLKNLFVSTGFSENAEGQSFLLKEDGFFILQENGFRIIL